MILSAFFIHEKQTQLNTDILFCEAQGVKSLNTSDTELVMNSFWERSTGQQDRASQQPDGFSLGLNVCFSLLILPKASCSRLARQMHIMSEPFFYDSL